MHKFSVATVLLTATLSALCATPANTAAGDTGATASSDRIRANAAKQKELRDLLNDREPSVRLSAFDALSGSPDPAAQELAFEVGFSSADTSMRALALRKRLSRLANFTVEVTDAASESIAKAQREGKPNPAPTNVSWLVIAADERVGVLKLHDTQRDWPPDRIRAQTASVSISGLNVTISSRGLNPECEGSLKLDEANVLAGSMICTGSRVGSYSSGDKVFMKVRMRLQ